MQTPTAVRRLAVVTAVAMLAALLPTVAAAQERSTLLCPDDAPAADFDDRDAISAAHREAVDCLAYLGVVEGLGYDEGVRYLPGAEVRRDQMAAYIVRALEAAAGDIVPAPDDQGFEDIEGRHHADRIRQLAGIGVAEGTSESTYSPGEPVTRAQMATFLLRATAWFRDTTVDALAGGPTRFHDIDGSAHQPRIEGAYHLGITAGVDRTSFAPGQAVTRQQMATFVVASLHAMHDDPTTCSNHDDGYTVTMPSGWHTNPGDIVAHCSVFDRERFALEPDTEIPGGLAVRFGTAPLDYEDAAGEQTRSERSRRTDTAGGRDAIVVESEATGEGLYPEGTVIYTWYVDAPDTAGEPTLLADTTSLSDDFAANKDALDGMMDSLVFGTPTRREVAAYEGGGRPFTVEAWAGGNGLCTQARAVDAVDTVCVPFAEADELEVRVHDLGDDLRVLAGSVDDTIDTVEVESDAGDIEEPALEPVWSRQVFATGIAYDEVAEVRAIRDGEVVVTAEPQ